MRAHIKLRPLLLVCQRHWSRMVTLLKKEDFYNGGLFAHVILPSKLPIPIEIVQHIYGEQACDRFITKRTQMFLLKYIWKIKGFEMEWCLCKTNHLILLEEYNALVKNSKVCQLDKETFTDIRGLNYGRIDLNHLQTPLPQFVIKLLFGFVMVYYNSLPEGECFKSDQYHCSILKKIFGFYGKRVQICNCSFGTHLVDPNCEISNLFNWN